MEGRSGGAIGGLFGSVKPLQNEPIKKKTQNKKTTTKNVFADVSPTKEDEEVIQKTPTSDSLSEPDRLSSLMQLFVQIITRRGENSTRVDRDGTAAHMGEVRAGGHRSSCLMLPGKTILRANHNVFPNISKYF